MGAAGNPWVTASALGNLDFQEDHGISDHRTSYNFKYGAASLNGWGVVGTAWVRMASNEGTTST
jgi:hypothetical protein